jgi:hypothetical protein
VVEKRFDVSKPHPVLGIDLETMDRLVRGANVATSQPPGERLPI